VRRAGQDLCGLLRHGGIVHGLDRRGSPIGSPSPGPLPGGQGDGLGAVADAGLGEDAVEVGLHRGLADHQALGDLEVGSRWTSSRRAIGRSGGLSGARQARGVEDDRVFYGWSSVCLGVGDSAVLSLASGSSPDS
jgi:hypothetical protein